MLGSEARPYSEQEDIDEEPEEDPEEVEEEPEEDPEEVEEEPEEEIEEDPEEDPEEEPEEDPEEEIEEDPEEDPEEEIEEDPEEDLEEDNNENSDEGKLEWENSHLSFPMCGGVNSNDLGNELNDNPEEERGESVIEKSGTSRKCRKSRWEPSKKRRTRWEPNDSQNGLAIPSGLINSLELLMDPESITLRKKLMEINKKLQSSEFYDERPAGERSPSPEPIYDNHGVRINTRIARSKKKLVNQRKCIIAQLAEAILLKSAKIEHKAKLVKKLLIPDKEYPTYNFIGLIIGPKGNTIKKMEKETGAKICIRGKGSGDQEDEELHVLVEAAEQKALDAAVAMIEKLLIPVDDEKNNHKRDQLVELAKLRGTYSDPNKCELCKEQGHKKYACPLQDSTFKAVCCDLCGSFSHLTSNCSVSGLPQFCQDKSNKNVDPSNLYVAGLPPSIDDKRLKEMFLLFGEIGSARVMRNPATGFSKGYGFVKFENPSAAADAVKYMNGYKIEGRVLVVRVAGLKPVPSPLIQTSCIYGPGVSMLPQGSLPFPNNGSSYFPYPPSHFGCNINVASAEVLNVPPYVVSSTTEPKVTSDVSSYDFCDRIPNSVSQFPGDPDYLGSLFHSYFSSPAINEAQYPATNGVKYPATNEPQYPATNEPQYPAMNGPN